MVLYCRGTQNGLFDHGCLLGARADMPSKARGCGNICAHTWPYPVSRRRPEFSALKPYKPSCRPKPLIAHHYPPPPSGPSRQKTCVSPSSPSRSPAPPALPPGPLPTGSSRQVGVPLLFPVEPPTELIDMLQAVIRSP